MDLSEEKNFPGYQKYFKFSQVANAAPVAIKTTAQLSKSPLFTPYTWAAKGVQMRADALLARLLKSRIANISEDVAWRDHLETGNEPQLRALTHNEIRFYAAMLPRGKRIMQAEESLLTQLFDLAKSIGE